MGPGPSQLICPWEHSLTEKPNEEEKAGPQLLRFSRQLCKRMQGPEHCAYYKQRVRVLSSERTKMLAVTFSHLVSNLASRTFGSKG